MTAQKILLHVAAAQASDVSVLSTVVQAYKKAGLLATALSYAEVEGERGKGPTPLHLAIVNSSYENTVLLLKECQENCPETLTATWNGWLCVSSSFPAYSSDDIPMIDVVC